MPDAQHDFYAAAAATLTDSRYEKAALVPTLLDLLGSHRRVLSVGCGTGVDLRALGAHRPAQLVGFDLSHPLAVSARKSGLVPVVADFNNPFPFRRVFDGGVAFFVVHLVANLDEFFAHCRSVLVDRAPFLILTAGRDDIHRRFLNRYFPSLAANDSRRFPPEEQIYSSLDRIGFRSITAQPVYLGTETADAAYLRIISHRLWSSLASVPENEFAAGLRRLRRDVRASQNRTAPIQWDNFKTLITALAA